MAFDYTRCPEFAGPLTEPRTMDGRPVLDIQALARHSVRLPQLNPAAAPGEYIPVSRSEPLLDPDTRERERAEAAARYDAGEEALRAMFAGAARSAGADQLTARRTADELLKRAGTATPGITEQALDDLAEKVAKVVLGALAGEAEKPPRPHRRTRPLPDAEPAETPEDAA